MKRVQGYFALLVTALLILSAIPLSAMPTAFAQTQAKNTQLALASAARTTSSNSSTFPVGDADQLIGFLKVTATIGGTLDVKFQDSPDGGTTWFDITGAAFSQVASGSSTQTVQSTRIFGKNVRVLYTISGGGGFTFSVSFIAYKGSPTVVASSDLNASNLGTGTLPLARLSNIAGSNLAEDVVQTTSVTVATGSVLTLNATPVTLVAAPGAGKIVLIEEITCKLVFNSVAYTGSNALEFRYANGSGAKVTADLSSAFLDSASGTNYATVKGVVTALTPVANAAVVVFVPTADPGAGNSPLVFKIKYRVVTP